MPEQAHDGRAVLVEQINSQLNLFLSSIKTAIQNNLPNRNVLAETTLMGLLNLIHDWKLVNANSIRQNFPGIDLIDTDKKIGIQVTSTNTLKKVDNTLEKVAKLPDGVKLEHLHIMVITTDAPTSTMKERRQAPYFTGSDDIWNISTLLGQIEYLPIPKLEAIRSFMDGELGTLQQKLAQKYLHLPLFSALDKDSFVGREKEMTEIRNKLISGAKPIVLSGLGGMGKTELAVRFGKNYEEDKKGNVFFIRFEDSFIRTLAKMANGVRPSLSQEALSRPEEELCVMVLDILEGCGENDILIVDNVDADSGIFNNLLTDDAYDRLYKMNIRLLITTRFKHDRSVLPISTLGTDELRKIFTNHQAPVDQAQADALIAAVKGHTLTIDLIARTLADEWTPVTPEEMLDALAQCTLADADLAEVNTDWHESKEQLHIYQRLRKVFEVANIPETEQDILRFATLLPESGMDVRYFRAALTKEQQKAFPALGKRGWLNAEDGVLTIHPVIRLVCREELKPDEESCGKFLDALWGQLGRDEYDRVKFAQMAEVFAAAMEIDGRPKTRAEWLNSSGRLLLDLMESRKAAALYERYIPELEQKIPAHPTLAISYGNAGTTYGDLGNHKKALEYKLKALAIREKVLPPEHPDLAQSYNNVGYTYGDLGDHSKALEYLLKALEIHEKVLPPEHPDLAISYGNVGSTYGDLGEHSKALEYKLKALAIREKVLPPEHPSLATSYNNVSYTYSELGDTEKDLEYGLKALAIREKVLPPEHPSLAQSYNNVGSTYGDLGDHSKALEYLLKALEIWEKVLPPDHPDLATSYNNVGSTYGALGDHSKALEFKLKALVIREKVLPPEHPDLAISYGNVGTTYGAMGEYEKKLEYEKKMLRIFERVLPEWHPHLGQAYNNIGVTYANLKQFSRAAEYLEKALVIRKKSLPATHPYIAETEQSLEAIRFMAMLQEAGISLDDLMKGNT